MNDSNKLLVISTIYVPIMMILLFYPQINDFYTYSVPLNSLELWNDYLDSPKEFKRIRDLEGSKCFTTPSQNEFCYYKPGLSGKTSTSTLAGNNVGFDGGEMHFDNVKTGTFYFTIKNMTQINGDVALMTLADNDYRVGNKFRTIYEITDKFELVVTVEKFDTFIAKCDNYEGTSVTIVQYLGIETIEGDDYFVTWHTGADLDDPITCVYPEIIQHSLRHDFGI